jgi:hypothetical protein
MQDDVEYASPCDISVEEREEDLVRVRHFECRRGGGIVVCLLAFTCQLMPLDVTDPIDFDQPPTIHQAYHRLHPRLQRHHASSLVHYPHQFK